MKDQFYSITSADQSGLSGLIALFLVIIFSWYNGFSQDPGSLPSPGKLTPASPFYLETLVRWEKTGGIGNGIDGISADTIQRLAEKCIFTLLNNRKGAERGAVMIRNNGHAWSMDQESADLNSYLVVEKKCMSALAGMLGEEEQSSLFRNEAENITGMIRRYMWVDREGFFFDIRLETKKPVRVMEPNGWIPLWAGIADKGQAEKIRDHIMNDSEFNTRVPFPTVAANHPEFNPEKGYWRGPVWLDQAWFAIDGLRKYGFRDEANTLTLKLLKNCEGLLNPGVPIRENYHPVSGKGLNSENFSWSAAHILMLVGADASRIGFNRSEKRQ